MAFHKKLRYVNFVEGEGKVKVATINPAPFRRPPRADGLTVELSYDRIDCRFRSKR